MMAPAMIAHAAQTFHKEGKGEAHGTASGGVPSVMAYNVRYGDKRGVVFYRQV